MVIREHQLRVLGAEMQLEARAKYAGIASEEELQQLYNLFGLLKNTHPDVVCRLSFWDDLEVSTGHVWRSVAASAGHVR